MRSSTEETILRFISIAKAYDFWTAAPKWPALELVYDELIEVENFYLTPPEQRNTIIPKDSTLNVCLEFLEDSEEFNSAQNKINEVFLRWKVQPLWQKLCLLGSLYEELCKEWFLPTYFWEEGPLGKKYNY